MSDLSRFVANKLSGEWSASNVSGVLTDVIIEYLVTGEKWESLDPLVRSRLLLAPLFMRKRDLAELRPALAKLAAAGAADKDEWVRAMAQSVGDYDGRLHNDRLLAGSKLVGKTVAGLQPLLDSADARLFRPLEEVYMNKELLQKLRGSSAAQSGAQQAAAAAVPAAPKPHHHFRLRPASEAPSQRHPGGSAAAGGRPAAPAAPAAAAAPQAGLTRGAAPTARPIAASGLGNRGPGVGGGSAASAAARARHPAGGDIDSMFLPRKPSLQRPAGLGGRGRGAAAPPVRRAATLDVEAAKNLAQQMQAERAKAEQAAREAAEAQARAKAEAKAAERAVREAEKEVEAKKRAAEKAAAKEAARAEKEAARAAAKAAKDEGKEEKEKAKAARAEAAAAKAAAKAAKQQQRKRSASEGEEPPAKRSATSGSEGVQRGAAALPTPEAAAEALGEAALAAAADAAGMQLGRRGGRPDVEAMQAYLAAAYGSGQPGAGSRGDVEEEHI